MITLANQRNSLSDAYCAATIVPGPSLIGRSLYSASVGKSLTPKPAMTDTPFIRVGCVAPCGR